MIMVELWNKRSAITDLFVITPALGLLVIGVNALAQPRYSVTDLTSLTGLPLTPFAVNNQSQVAGAAFFPGFSQSHAFLYSGSGITDLGTLGGACSFAVDLNGSGQLVGGSYTRTADSTLNGFLYSGATMLDLGTFGGAGSMAWGINQMGALVGRADTPTGYHAFLYNQGQMTDLGTFGGPYSSASAINNKGQIVGSASTTGNLASYAFLYSDGRMVSLGRGFGYGSYATDINDNGQIVGGCNLSASIAHAFYYSDGVMRDLGTSPDEFSQAMAINNRGQAIGYTSRAGQNHSFLYSDGVLYDLESLLEPGSAGWTFQYAYDINDNGQIVCQGVNPQTHHVAGVLLTPVPEPAAGTLFAVGLIWLLRKGKADQKGT